MTRYRRRCAVGAVLALLIPLALTARAAGDERIAYLAWSEGYWQVWTMRPDGSEAAALTRSPTDKTRVSWFPDGGSLLVNALDGTLSEVDAQTGAERPIPIELRGTHDAVAAPDSGRIAFSLSTAGAIDDNEIWLAERNGQDLKRVTLLPGLQHQPQWGPRERYVYFLSGESSQEHDLHRVDLASGSTEKLTAGDLYHFELAVSRDERWAYSNNRTGNYEIYVKAPDEAPALATRHPALDGSPSWGPNGRLVFHSLRSGSLQVWRLDRLGSEPIQLTHHAQGARRPVWWTPQQVGQEAGPR